MSTAQVRSQTALRCPAHLRLSVPPNPSFIQFSPPLGPFPLTASDSCSLMFTTQLIETHSLVTECISFV